MASESEQEKRETLAEVVAMLRANARGERFDEFSFTSLADRIEAAWRRERAEFDCECAGIAELAAKEEAARHKPGNAAALREALVVVRNDLWEMMGSSSDSFRERKACDMARRIRAALSAPARQCDVGTADEQMKRQYDTMCNTTNACPDSDWSCRKCFAQWAQTPYAEEGAGK